MTRAATSSISIKERLLAVVLVFLRVASGTEDPLCSRPRMLREDQRSAYLPWLRTAVKVDDFREASAILEKFGVCAARRDRRSGFKGGSTRKLSVVLRNVGSGGRKEQPVMLGLLWDGVPSDATKKSSSTLLPLVASFPQIYGWGFAAVIVRAYVLSLWLSAA